MTKAKVLDIIVFLFVTLFMYAAISKLTEYREFEAQISKSPLILEYSTWLAFMVPIVEILISLLLLIPRTQLVALYAAFSLMFLFTAYIAFMLVFSPYVPCSCGGILSRMGWEEHLVFNSIFTLLGLIGISLNLKVNPPQSKVVAFN
jgi:uncharacterized membrane protein YphA (DoxX/SURF4 family)